MRCEYGEGLWFALERSRLLGPLIAVAIGRLIIFAATVHALVASPRRRSAVPAR